MASTVVEEENPLQTLSPHSVDLQALLEANTMQMTQPQRQRRSLFLTGHSAPQLVPPSTHGKAFDATHVLMTKNISQARTSKHKLGNPWLLSSAWLMGR